MRPSPFWTDKSVFITGHTGFKGSWLSLWLQLLGAKVTGFALAAPTDPNMFGLCDVARRMNSILGDVRDLDALTRALQQSRAEVVIHLAGQSLVRESYKDPVGTFLTNVIGSVNMLEAVRRCDQVRAVVMVTSDKCYKNHEWFWSYREKSQLGGDDPYSASKASAEMAIAAYRHSFFNPKVFQEHRVGLATARAGNVIGGGDWAKDRLVPDVMRALMAGQPMRVRNPEATRPWQHVLEPVNGYVTLAEALWRDGPRFSSPWNFGPFDFNNKNVGSIVASLCAFWGVEHGWERDTKSHPHENTFLKLDSSKARNLLGWAPKLDLATTLKWIVDWTKAHHGGADLRSVTESQILDFMDRPALEFAPSTPERLAGRPV